jgi:hypothetical protein
MSIPRVWPNGVGSMPVDGSGRPILASSDAASLDASVQRALDKSSAGGTTQVELRLDGGGLSLDSPTSQLLFEAEVQFSGDAALLCGNDDFPVTQVAAEYMTSCLEVMGSSLSPSLQAPAAPNPIFGTNPYWYVNSAGQLVAGTQYPTTGYAVTLDGGYLMLPVTRIHDGASLSGSGVYGFGVYFAVNPARTTLPTRYPQMNVFRYDPYQNELISIIGGWGSFPPPFPNTIAQYISNGGEPNSWAFAVTNPDPVDLSRYLYFVAIYDEDYGGDTSPDYRNMALGNTYLGAVVPFQVPDLRFS